METMILLYYVVAAYIVLGAALGFALKGDLNVVGTILFPFLWGVLILVTLAALGVMAIMYGVVYFTYWLYYLIFTTNFVHRHGLYKREGKGSN